jgi:uncharacterized protein (TIGR00290 family)
MGGLMSAIPTLLSWSSGKDSAWTLHRLRQDPTVELVGLVTTLNQTHDRVAMHAVRRRLLERQARAAGLPLYTIELPWPCPNGEYERRMGAFIEEARGLGVRQMAFGDLYLEDIRRYREERLAGTGITPLFPLWGLPTAELAREMFRGGLRAILTCIDPRVMPPGLCGADFDEALLAALPAGVDPCGEGGEFHSFCWDGPMFRAPIPVRRGERVERGGFVFTDLLPADEESSGDGASAAPSSGEIPQS